MIPLLVTLLLIGGSLTAAPPPVDPPADLLATLNPEHPRLLATASDFARVREGLNEDPSARSLASAVIRQADGILTAPLPQHVIPDGKRLLATSQLVKDRMQRLGMAWQLTGDRKYPERAWKDLEAAGNFPDWNPPHFLDTAVMTRAFAIALDWMDGAWTPAQKERICQWIIRQGLAPAMAGYRDPSSSNGRQLRSSNNWGQVTDGGIGMGALAIADLHPTEAREALAWALKCIRPSVTGYAPDGGWEEGYGYYGFAMEYAVGLISSLFCSLGTDFGLSSLPGFSMTPDFPTALEGPCGTFFGFGDCGHDVKKITSIPEAGWVATRFGNPVAAAAQRGKAPAFPDPLGLLWLPPVGDRSLASTNARTKSFAANACCTLRTSWTDPDAGFVGFKAGNNTASHGHLDIGSFVYDTGGRHWAVDLGSDNYNLPDYFGKRRWDYYRLRAEGNNTLVVNPDRGPDQSLTANCPLILCADRGHAYVAVGDLGAAYPMMASVRRGVRLADDGSLRIQDELDTGSAEARVLWFMHTPAAVTVSPDGLSARLSLGGKTITARLTAPSDARLEVMEPVPLPDSPNPPGQMVNRGITKLAVRSTFRGARRIIVDLTPEGTQVPPLTPLGQW